MSKWGAQPKILNSPQKKFKLGRPGKRVNNYDFLFRRLQVGLFMEAQNKDLIPEKKGNFLSFIEPLIFS